MAMNPKGLLMSQKKLYKFDEVHNSINKLSDRNYPDTIVEFKDIHVIPDNTDLKIEINEPHKILQLTDWSKKQLGSKLGINFDKWFTREIEGNEIKKELELRFIHMNETIKIRSQKHAKSDSNYSHSDGFIRAFLSPNYFTIDDIHVFDRLHKVFRRQFDEMYFIKNYFGSDFYNEKTSNYNIIGEPINVGPINPNHITYDITEYENRLSDDWIYQGIHLRNSEVGYAALTIDYATLRLICLNGAITSTKNGRLLYRAHRKIKTEEIDNMLNSAFTKLPDIWEFYKNRILLLHRTVISNPEKELEEFLSKNKATKFFINDTKEAFKAEPSNTSYGIWQAIARAAKSAPSIEKRFELEELAGKYLAAA